MKRSTCCLFAIALAGASTLAAHADTIRLKASVRLDADAESVRLADVAELEGPEAAALGGTIVAELAEGDARTITIPLRTVRAALDAAGAHWGRVNLSGDDVVLRPRRRTAAAPVAMAGATLDGASRGARRTAAPTEDDHVAASLLGDGTLRAAVARAVVRELGVAPEDVRIMFDAGDRARLALDDDTHRFEIKPDDRLTSDRATVGVRVWVADRVVDRFHFTLRTLVRAATVVLRRGVDRGDLVSAADVDVKTQWLEPMEARMACSPEEARDHVATRRLEAGSVLRHKHVRPPVVVERGERVTVRCLVGGTVITLQAEALADGAAGDKIELRKLGERTTFIATVSAPGQATVDLGR